MFSLYRILLALSLNPTTIFLQSVPMTYDNRMCGLHLRFKMSPSVVERSRRGLVSLVDYLSNESKRFSSFSRWRLDFYSKGLLVDKNCASLLQFLIKLYLVDKPFSVCDMGFRFFFFSKMTVFGSVRLKLCR